MVKPICFMVMPFQRKLVTRAKDNAPTEVNCDRLWDAVFRPVLDSLGFLPVRADLDPGAVIVKDMLNRLKHADLVLADVSLPNGNVYYELGIRHVAQQTGCVVIAANWFKPLFDIDYVRTILYPLKSGEIPDDEAETIRAHLLKRIPEVLNSKTPYHELVDENVEEAFTDHAEQLSDFQADLAEVRLMSNSDERADKIREIREKYYESASSLPEIAVELLYVIRDAADWQSVRDYVDSLPDSISRTEIIQEQYCLALSELGEHEKAIARLKQLIQRFGETPERCGIIGGRHKRLYRKARREREQANRPDPSSEERKNLRQAIESYERGMMLDLNEYYCSCNLPALLRARNSKDDLLRADTIEHQVILACMRAELRNSRDPWLPDTLFGTAFRSGNVAALDDIVDKIEEGVPWRLGSTLNDADDWIRQAPDESRDDLSRVLQRLRDAHRNRGSG